MTLSFPTRRSSELLALGVGSGGRRRYERLHGRGHGAVAVVPMLDDDTVLLVREYAAGVHRYELGLVKGRIDAGETPEHAANRELMEEAGYGANSVQVLRSRSEEHTSELQSLMRNSYAVFCLKKKKQQTTRI